MLTATFRGRCVIAVISTCLAPAMLAAQAPTDIARQIVGVHTEVVRLVRAKPDAIWPGFHPDTIPVLYVLPRRGTLLVNWPGALPAGFERLAGTEVGWRSEASRSAASTGTTLDGRGTAQVVVDSSDDMTIASLTMHETFHVFARASASGDRRFGSDENALLVTSYPVFDIANESGMALEGKLLSWGLVAPSLATMRLRARHFVAQRETRHRQLGAERTEFESRSELNEGLAEYALVRGLQLAVADSTVRWRAAAASDIARRIAHLDSLTSNSTRSVRIRFYETGTAMALLLDRMVGPSWKAELVAHDRTLVDQIAEVSGYRDQERSLTAEGDRLFRRQSIDQAATAEVARLRERRRAQVDSVLEAPGLQIELSGAALPNRTIGLCSFDPQNALQVDERVLLHTRFVLACAGSALSAEFTTGVVDDRGAGTMRAVVGRESDVRVTAGGRLVTLADGERRLGATDVRIASERLTMQAARADLERVGRVLRVRVLVK